MKARRRYPHRRRRGQLKQKFWLVVVGASMVWFVLYVVSIEVMR